MTIQYLTGALVSAVIPSNARAKWAEGEVDIFLDIISSMGLQSALLRKRNAKIFKLLSKEMAKRSFEKAPEKLRIKFQHLRRQYNKAKNGGDTFEHYEAMHQLLNPVKKPGAETEANYSSGSDSDYIYSDDGDADTSRNNRRLTIEFILSKLTELLYLTLSVRSSGFVLLVRL